MFGLGIRYLNGWAMAAADGANKQRAEWPPHPDRVYMALAAAWFETEKDGTEKDALLWLETIGPPGIAASEADQRCAHKGQAPTTSFVPINDSAIPISVKYKNQVRIERPFQMMGSFQIGRDRKPRSFPVAIPRVPIVHLVWTVDLPRKYHASLISLCRKVISIGHPASLVQMWLDDSPPAPTLVVREGVTRHRLRVFGPGRLDYLAEKCDRDKHIAIADALWAQEQRVSGSQRNKIKKERETYLYGIIEQLRPDPGPYKGYDVPRSESVERTPRSLFDPRLLVLTLFGKRLSLPSTLRLTETLRRTLMAGAPQPVPEWLSGHTPTGSRSEKPHLAFLPLPFIGREHADGRLMGVGLALPREVTPSEAARVLEPWLRDNNGLVRRHRLFDGRWFECNVELETRESPPFNSQPETWTRHAAAWGSVTPVVLDRHFDGNNKWELAVENIKDACERIDLPRPDRVLLHPVSMFEGVPRSNEFPYLTRKKDGGRMHHIHAVILFNEEVEGPVIVGAGRFRGYGLCRPLRQGGGEGA
ncbi:MAG: type I-G CRISPR-associated protein Csb2 [Syntrophales bacterium]